MSFSLLERKDENATLIVYHRFFCQMIFPDFYLVFPKIDSVENKKKTKNVIFFRRNWYKNRLRISIKIRITPEQLNVKVWASYSLVDFELVVRMYNWLLQTHLSHLTKNVNFQNNGFKSLEMIRWKGIQKIPIRLFFWIGIVLLFH